MSDSTKKSALAKLRHDLRTPINHILGYSELLKDDLSDRGEQTIEDLSKIEQAAQTLLHLINTGLTDDLSLAAAENSEKQPLSQKRRTAAQSDENFAEENEQEPSVTGRILVVDDQKENRETLARRLRNQGHTVHEATDGLEALENLTQHPFDLVLLDLLMPKMDGCTALRRMKADEQLRHIPVIMISALDEIESLVTCIEAGAEDYLPKPFNPVLLRARIGATLEKKALRDQERAHLETIEETQKRLQDELHEASRYVASILPHPVERPIGIRWEYTPSTELGGDSFDYHWIDDTHLAVYLLDVCGHGVGAALLSVAAINMIRSAALPGVDFRDPGQILSGLNETFRMERHNNMYFTIWYGIYNIKTRELRHSSGGHPPALLLHQTPEGKDTITPLRCPGRIIGVIPGTTYESETLLVPENARLFVFSDGAYEIRKRDGGMIDFEEDFCRYLCENGRQPDIARHVLHWIRKIRGSETLDDDFSFLALDL